MLRACVFIGPGVAQGVRCSTRCLLRFGFAVAGRGGHRVDVPASALRDARPFQESGNAKSMHKEHAHEAGSSSHVLA